MRIGITKIKIKTLTILSLFELTLADTGVRPKAYLLYDYWPNNITTTPIKQEPHRHEGMRHTTSGHNVGDEETVHRGSGQKIIMNEDI